MRRLIAMVALSALATFVFVGTSSAAPAPKTTGGIGYTAYSDVQRHLEFNAIQSKTDTCGTFWNVTGVSSFVFEYQGSTYPHHVTLAQTGQTVGGDGGYPLSGGDQYHWNVTQGSVIGNALELTAEYDLGAVGTTMQIHGTINPDGSITGTWSDDLLRPGPNRTGTFSAAKGSVTPYATYCGKGTAYYSDADGNWYFVNVKAVSLNGADAWFAGPVVAGNVGVGNWLFVKVHDGGEPGKIVDLASGSFTTESAALAGVGAQGTPADGPFTITSGNLQVH